jgi:hypothetical protein
MIRYTSTLKQEYGEELEQLMFFNPGQQAALAAIVDSVEMYGLPSVYADDGRLKIDVEKLDEVQTLFALDGDRLVGVLVYSRVEFERLVVIHIAVGQDYSSNGKIAQNMLVMRLLELLRNSARRIKGIETIRMMHDGNRIRDYPV